MKQAFHLLAAWWWCQGCWLRSRATAGISGPQTASQKRANKSLALTFAGIRTLVPPNARDESKIETLRRSDELQMARLHTHTHIHTHTHTHTPGSLTCPSSYLSLSVLCCGFALRFIYIYTVCIVGSKLLRPLIKIPPFAFVFCKLNYIFSLQLMPDC